ncbi:MAG: hypothetical protein WD226_01405 [Planctomycetota bacterium]
MDSIKDWLFRFAGENLVDWTVTKVYLACAFAGGAVLLGQMGLTLLGFGDADNDFGVEDLGDMEGADSSLNFLSVRAIAGFLTFFGLVGWLGSTKGWGDVPTGAAALASGASVMVMIAWIMRSFQRLTASGNVIPANAVGRTARVYLRVPANREGKGKVTLSLQGRSVEFQAISRGAELPTGSDCRIVAMTSGDTCEVEPLD